MAKMLSMPIGNARVEKAIDDKDTTIGVSITMLVMPDDFEKLPEVFRQSAHNVYAAPRESMAEELERLAHEYQEGELSEREEAWNLIADFAYDNRRAICAALRAMSKIES